MFLKFERTALWGHKPFMRLWAAQSLSAFGNRITRTAVPIIAIVTLGVSPGMAALLAAISLMPMVLAGLLGGGLVERARKVRLMLVMDLLRFALVMLIPICFGFGLRSFWLLAAIAFLAGAASYLFQNADISVLPLLVDKRDIVEANAKLKFTESAAELFGPGAAGLLIQVLSAPIAIILDAVTFLWSAFWLNRITRDAPGADAPGGASGEARHPLATLREDIVVGFQATMSRPPIRALLFASVSFQVAAGFFAGLYMVFALRVLSLSPGVVGVIISMGGVSALGGVFLANWLSRRIGFGPAIVASFAAGMAGSALILPAAIWPSIGAPLLFLQQLSSDGAFMAYIILSTSLMQKTLPKGEIARANGLFQAVAGFSLLVMTLVSGAAADWLGVRIAAMIGGAASVLAIAPLLSPALLGMKEEPEGELEFADPAAPELAETI